MSGPSAWQGSEPPAACPIETARIGPVAARCDDCPYVSDVSIWESSTSGASYPLLQRLGRP